MIEISVNENDAFKIIQRDVSPTVYFDHWAWCEFSENQTLATRFANALKKRNGTLALSWLNLVEFGRMTDLQQARSADSLLDAILPHVFFIQPDFFKVVSEENKLIAGGAPFPPHIDIGLLDYFVRSNLSDPTSLKILTARNLHTLVQSAEIAEQYAAFADTGITAIENLRTEFDSNTVFQSQVQRMPSGLLLQRGTRFIRNELLRSFLVDKWIKVDRNNIIDLSHAIVPTAYCDYVLLDKHWEVQVNRARERIASGGLSFPMARVFSQRANGMEKFLCTLES